ncbi:MAG: HEAT repeat domain-containing protein [bacterium]|nr:HEAT repeat domain-containing protein [bacterium]
MRKTAWLALWGMSLFAGFAVGIAVGKAHKPEVQRRQPTTRTIPEDKDREEARLLASLDEFRNALTEKEQIAASLRAEIEEVRGKMLPPLSPEDEKWLRQEQKERGYAKRWDPIRKRGEELLKKIFQRKDNVLRQKGLDELESLLKNDKAQDKLVGLWTLNKILFEGVGLDKKRFTPLLAAALDHDDGEVRENALEHLGYLGYSDYPWMDRPEKREAADVALRMVNDPDTRVKSTALRLLADFGGKERDKGIAKALRSLLQDGSEESVSTALGAISDLPYDKWSVTAVYEGDEWVGVPVKRHDYCEEMRQEVIEASRNPETQDEVLEFWWERQTLDKEELERAAEILNGVNPDEYFRVASDSYPASPELRELAYNYYFRVIRESLDRQQRWTAVSRLEETGDKSLIPQLKALAASEDAEGIERGIEDAIKHLEQYGR